jgi:hypothetical protein
MQGFERLGGGLLDAAAVAGHLVPAGSMFAFLAAHRAEVFPDADYADLFAPPGVGRPSLPATRMAAVLPLQVLHDYSDRWHGIQQFGAELLGAGFDAGHARRLLDEAAEQADHPAGAAEKVLGHSPAGSSPALKSLSWDSIPDRWLVQAAMPQGCRS